MAHAHPLPEELAVSGPSIKSGDGGATGCSGSPSYPSTMTRGTPPSDYPLIISSPESSAGLGVGVDGSV
ncbi:hypothetical protein Tco_0384525, partial [Tanacetum coccineum]